jgi:hypothetical protein
LTILLVTRTIQSKLVRKGQAEDFSRARRDSDTSADQKAELICIRRRDRRESKFRQQPRPHKSANVDEDAFRWTNTDDLPQPGSEQAFSFDDSTDGIPKKKACNPKATKLLANRKEFSALVTPITPQNLVHLSKTLTAIGASTAALQDS